MCVCDFAYPLTQIANVSVSLEIFDAISIVPQIKIETIKCPTKPPKLNYSMATVEREKKKKVAISWLSNKKVEWDLISIKLQLQKRKKNW